ncbi:tannase/feruloyl esterase family alpha/beta hydrolase [Sphingosinicella sp.]|uniref:tannase/feruloyl esterase family alpha/beta hydrolase n=1 Tax=Sphingosinicella sp. TaxID=1917971 RepID=UPI0035B4A8EC
MRHAFVAPRVLACLAVAMLGMSPAYARVAADTPESEARCAALEGMSLTEGKVIAAGIPAAGTTFDSGLPLFPGAERLPFPTPLCRVELSLSAGPGSGVHAELWLPTEGRWNGKLVEAGNGGFGGSLADPMVTMRHAVLRGYAAAGNDMGHHAEDTGWFQRKEALIDYAWRADRLTSLAARKIIAAFYGEAARLHYFEGCSSGGRQALMAATRFPRDYDGIVAGAPAASYSRMMAAGAWMQSLLADPATRPTPDDLKLVGDAALAQCDSADGLTDGLIGDPRACRFDPSKLICAPGQDKACLTPNKAAFFKTVYNGVRDAQGRTVVPGMLVGAEAMRGGWHHWIAKADARHATFARGTIGAMMLQDPSWTPARFDLHRDFPAMREWFADFDADKDDLSAFRAHGGKMVVYHGWADAGINPYFTLDWYDRVVKTMGAARTEDTVALFMVPGLSHCADGPGPDNFQMLDALDGWRNEGIVPESTLGEWHEGPPLAAMLDLPSGPRKAARPICRFPRHARWDGVGDVTRPESFSCR